MDEQLRIVMVEILLAHWTILKERAEKMKKGSVTVETLVRYAVAVYVEPFIEKRG